MSNPISITLTFNTAKEVADFFASATGASQRVIASTVECATSGATTNNAPPKTAKASPATTKAEPAGDAIDRATVSALAVKLAVKNKAKAVEILAEHGVKAVKELADDDLAAVHAKLAAALDG